MPLYDWECLNGHRFEAVVRMDDRAGPIACTEGGCTQEAARVEISHSSPGTMLDYGLGLNREAVEKGTYDPLRPIQRGVRRHRGDKVPAS